jgi:oxaloacetate decarboxylase alpha subunit/pyruvate carboxylase subunit B
MKAITLDDVKRQEEIVKKAKAGVLVEKKVNGEIPEKTECLRTFNVFVDGEYFEVGVDEVGGAPVMAYAQPAQAMPQPAAAPAQGAKVAASAPKAAPAPKPAPAAPAPATADGAQVTAPMPGMVIKYEKNVGDPVKKGDTVVLLEAMKMENALPSPVDGEVTALNFSSGDSVAKGAVLAVIG